VKAFVRQMVRGRDLEMLATTGGSVECTVSLDRDLTEMIIRRSQSEDAKQRVVPLRSVERVAVGSEAEDDVELPVDELCVTLLLEGGRALAFRLGRLEDRDAFASCLTMLISGNRKEGRKRSL